MFRMELCLQRCHCMTTDLCRLSETDWTTPTPHFSHFPHTPASRPGRAQERKCLKNICLSAVTAAKMILSSHFDNTRPLEKKSKETTAPFRPQKSKSLKTHGGDKEKTTEIADGGQKRCFSCSLMCCRSL
ncbi:hypothetical protein GOODEAATRI_000627 [Goodea atripinnis]|uniref:Uncharacterized protein n=1 Tax=Goodea atripinnis TaxID=208336 RepID=A0ABV0P093_9TELE